MKIILKLADDGLHRDPLIRAWLDQVAAQPNTPDMIEQRELQRSDLLNFGTSVSIDGKRVDPAEFFNPPRDSTPD